MALMTPNPNGSGDGLDDDLTEGDIILRDENGNEIHFQSLDLDRNEEIDEDKIEETKENDESEKLENQKNTEEQKSIKKSNK